MNKDIFKLERDLIFNAALKLMKEGRYYTATLAEIAYHAGLTEMTTQVLFRSKDILTSELVSHVSDIIRGVIYKRLTKGLSRKERFFRVWHALHEFYVSRPEVLAFFEQDNSPMKLFPNDRPTSSILALLGDDLVESSEDVDLSLFAPLFHASVATSARLDVNENIPDGSGGWKVAAGFWEFLNQLQPMGLRKAP